MASRFKTRVSFGAFANIRTQLQHNISTNAMYSSMRRLLLILNNNFAYIVNTWNFFTKSNYTTDYQLFTSTKNETSDTSDIVYKGDDSAQSESIKTIQWYLDKIDLLNRRLDNIEKILAAAGERPKFVPAEIGFYLKNNKTTLYSGTDYVGQQTSYFFDGRFGTRTYYLHTYYANYSNGMRGYTNYINDPTHLCNTQAYRLGNDKTVIMNYTFQIQKRGYAAQYLTFDFGLYGYGFKVPSGKYFSKDIQIFQGAQIELEIPITTYMGKLGAPNTSYQFPSHTLSGTTTLVVVLSGRHNGVFDGSYIELKNGVTL